MAAVPRIPLQVALAASAERAHANAAPIASLQNLQNVLNPPALPWGTEIRGPQYLTWLCGAENRDAILRLLVKGARGVQWARAQESTGWELPHTPPPLHPQSWSGLEDRTRPPTQAQGNATSQKHTMLFQPSVPEKRMMQISVQRIRSLKEAHVSYKRT